MKHFATFPLNGAIKMLIIVWNYAQVNVTLS